MDKKIMILVTIIVLVGFSGCSTNIENEDYDISEDELNEPYVDEFTDDSENEYQDNNADEEKTMKFCESTKETDIMKYEYYWTEDEFYEKVTTSNGGESIKIATADTICVMLAGSSVEGWKCSDGSEAQFQETVGVVRDLLNSPIDMYGFVCEDIPYDGTVFDTN